MYKKCNKKPDKQKIRGYIYRNLAMREWARKMLFKKAVAKFEDASMVNEILDEFQENGLLSNIRFAEAYIRSCRDSRGYGPIKTKMRLMEKGVSPSEYEHYLCENHDIWVIRCRKEREKKFGMMPDCIEDRAKQQRFLQQRGFNGKQIRYAFSVDLPFDEYEVELPEDENQEKVSLEDLALTKVSELK
jgi:regulatory protein